VSYEVAGSDVPFEVDDDSMYGPVSDWMNDFDHADPYYNEHTWSIWSEMREQCPVAHSERYGGAWLPVTHAAVTEIAYDTETFSNRGPLVVRGLGAMDLAEMGDAVNLTPLTSDPPNHTAARQPVLPFFSPKRINLMEDEIRADCIQLLDEIGDAEHIDGAGQYAQHIPTIVTCRILGFPIEDADQLRKWTKDGFENINIPPQERIARFLEQQQYFDRMIEEHRAEPREDMTTFLINATYRGEPFSHDRIRHNMSLLMVAGIDTTWSSIGSSLWHLGTHPDHLERLVREPELWPNAVEEFLRVYAPVTMARKATRDVEFHGCPIKKNDWVLLPFPSANVDPTVWDRPEEVVLDRQENRHYAFGLGVHRCLGSNLARVEMRVALEEFVRRFPRFELVESAEVGWSVGQIKGPRKVPLRILDRATAA
jgi:cytochrome P450